MLDSPYKGSKQAMHCLLSLVYTVYVDTANTMDQNKQCIVCCVSCVCWHCWHKGSKHCKCYVMYVEAINTKHIHRLLPITFLIFNQLEIWKKSFEKLRLRAFQPYQMLCILTLSMQVISISNAFNAIYVKAFNTFSTQYSHM